MKQFLNLNYEVDQFGLQTEQHIIPEAEIDNLLILAPKFDIPSTLNIDLISWHIHFIVTCSEVLNHGLNHDLFLSL
jgi:hypothetical protein